MRNLFLYGLVASLVGCAVARGPVQKPEVDLVEPQRAAGVVYRVAIEFGSRYVFPDKAKEVEGRLIDALGSGDYAGVDSGRELAERLTQEIRSVTSDMHASVVFSPRVISNAAPDEMVDVARVERLRGGIGYIDLRRFSNPSRFNPKAIAAIRHLSDTSALVVDLRNASGGDASAVAYFCSFFFGPDEPVQLSTVHFRGRAPIESWAMEVPIRYVGNPVYVLTSGRTSSGAEAFSYDLKVLGRATIVGETTRGGAHVGESLQIDSQFRAFIPTGRAENPLTNSNWEKVGVRPDIVAAADSALEAAVTDYLKQAIRRTGDIESAKILQDLLAQLETKGAQVLFDFPSGAP